MTTTQSRTTDRLFEEAEKSFEHWELLKELIDESIDLALNYRQSGHPGGSRSKVHLFLALLLSGAMRWDLRRPWRPFMDRFVLSAGHTVPLVYATLAILNEVLRARHERDPREEFTFPDDGRWALTWEDLLLLRRRHGLPGHAEMEGKTLFIKFNTGPSGHGMPPAAGEAVALKLAGCAEVKVFVVEGEGGLTPGASHETRNSAWGLGLSNLVFLLDWNDYGIDDVAIHEVVPGTPESWFNAYHWRVTGTEQGSEWEPVTRAVLEAARGENPNRVPSVAWFKTRKGRGYGKYDNKSHGTPWPMNAPEFWAVRKQFMERHGVAYAGVDEPAPNDAAEREAQAAQLQGGDGRAAGASGDGGCHQRSARGGCRIGPRRGGGDQPGRSGCADLRRPTDQRRSKLPAHHVEEARREGAQPCRAGDMGRMGQRVRSPGIRPATGDRLLRRPRRLDEHRRVCQGLRGDAWLGLVQPRDEPARLAAAPGDHRVHQRGRDGGHRHRQPRGRPDACLQRLLGRLLDVRLLQLSEVRTDAPLLAAGAGL